MRCVTVTELYSVASIKPGANYCTVVTAGFLAKLLKIFKFKKCLFSKLIKHLRFHLKLETQNVYLMICDRKCVELKRF
jgi:hypothetical protein